MKAFAYRAVHNETGEIQKGQISATDESELSYFLRELNLDLIEAKQKEANANHFFTKRLGRHPSRGEIIGLTQFMSDMLQAGVDFEEAFTLCAASINDNLLRDSLRQITQDVRSGHHVSAAFARHPTYFDPVFLSLLEAGEMSGDLSTAFARISKHLKWEDDMRNRVRKAVRYPLFLLCLAIFVVTFMLSYVLPELITFLASVSHDLPLSTRILISSAELFTQAWWLIPLLVGGGLTATMILKRASKDTAILVDKAILSLPLMGEVLKKLALVRFSNSLSLLVKSGLPLPKALSVAKRSLGNPALERDATQSHAQLLSGQPFSKAAAILFPPFALQMLKVGEKSGTMQTTLGRIAKSLDEQAKDSVDRFLGLLEPTLTLLVGGLMAWIVLAILGPVYSSLGPLTQVGY